MAQRTRSHLEWGRGQVGPLSLRARACAQLGEGAPGYVGARLRNPLSCSSLFAHRGKRGARADPVNHAPGVGVLRTCSFCASHWGQGPKEGEGVPFARRCGSPAWATRRGDANPTRVGRGTCPPRVELFYFYHIQSKF